MTLQPYELNKALDMLMEHYDEGKYAPEDDEKPMTQVERNMRSKMKKQLEEFCTTKQPTMFMQGIMGMCESSIMPERIRNHNKKLRNQIKMIEKENEGQVALAIRYESDKLKEEYKQKFEEDNEELIKQLEFTRQRNRKYVTEIEKAHEQKKWIQCQKILTTDEWSHYSHKKAELLLLGLWDEDISIKSKIKEMGQDKSTYGKDLKKSKKLVKKLRLRIEALESQINSSSSSSEEDEDSS